MVVCVLYHYCKRNAGWLNDGLTVAILRDDTGPPVTEEKKAIFYATAELNVRRPFLELDTKC